MKVFLLSQILNDLNRLDLQIRRAVPVAEIYRVSISAANGRNIFRACSENKKAPASDDRG